LDVDPDSGVAVGEVRFFTVGTGNYVGAARIDYEVVCLDEQDEKAPLKRNGEADRARRLREEGMTKSIDEVGGVLRKLWELEREVWAHRAEELE
jgi:hypothetical protein